MLVVHISRGKFSGECRINGETCEFRIEGDRFDYKPESQTEWERRFIQEVLAGDDQDIYVCSTDAVKREISVHEENGRARVSMPLTEDEAMSAMIRSSLP